MLNTSFNTAFNTADKTKMGTVIAVAQKFMELSESQKQFILGYMVAVEQQAKAAEIKQA